MKKTIFTLLTVLFFSTTYSQNSLWNKVSDDRITVLEKMDRISIPSNYDSAGKNCYDTGDK